MSAPWRLRLVLCRNACVPALVTSIQCRRGPRSFLDTWPPNRTLMASIDQPWLAFASLETNKTLTIILAVGPPWSCGSLPRPSTLTEGIHSPAPPATPFCHERVRREARSFSPRLQRLAPEPTTLGKCVRRLWLPSPPTTLHCGPRS